MNNIDQRERTNKNSVITGYVFAVLLIGVLTVIKLLLGKVLPGVYFRVLDVLLIGLVAFMYGRGPGFVAFVLSIVGYLYIYIPPRFNIRLSKGTSENWIPFAILMVGDVVAVVAMSSLRESRQRLRATFDNAGVGIVEANAENRFVAVNNYVLQILGYKRNDMLGKTIHDFTAPEDWQHSDEIYTQLHEGAQDRFDYEKQYLRRDGSRIWVHVTTSAVRDSRGRFQRSIATIEDISDRKEAEEALRDSEERFRTLADNISQLVWMADEKGEIFWYNKRWLEYTGATHEEMLARGWQNAFHPDYVQRVMAKFNSGIETGKPWEDTFPLRSKDGDYRWFISYAVPIKDEYGRVHRWFGTITDITDLREVQEELRNLTDELEQRVVKRTAELEAANKELEAFSYSVSHDLRAPLRAIDGFSNTLLKSYRDSLDARGQDYLLRVRAAAQRMAQLIDDILGLSRASRAEMRRQRIDLSAMVSEILSDLQKLQPERKAEVVIEPGMIVNADNHLLRILLDNLLGNAWKFTNRRDIAHIEIGSFDQNGERVYYVKDNGAGFDPTYADKLFSPFQRLHAESDFPGTGIGLALSQRIIRRHGGRIWAESVVDQGATLYFTLGETPNE